MSKAPPFMPEGTVYGTLLNFQGEMEALAPQMDLAPYKAAPRAPVLYVKTANTWSANDSVVPTGTCFATLLIPAQKCWDVFAGSLRDSTGGEQSNRCYPSSVRLNSSRSGSRAAWSLSS